MTKADLHNNALDLVNISIRLFRAQRDLIDEATALVPERNLSEYVREILTMQAALDLGVETPRVPDISRGRGGSMIAQAAAKLGMTRPEFEAQAIRFAASQALGSDALLAPSEPPASRSSIRPAARPGMYSTQPEARAHGRKR